MSLEVAKRVIQRVQLRDNDRKWFWQGQAGLMKSSKGLG